MAYPKDGFTGVCVRFMVGIACPLAKVVTAGQSSTASLAAPSAKCSTPSSIWGSPATEMNFISVARIFVITQKTVDSALMPPTALIGRRKQIP